MKNFSLVFASALAALAVTPLASATTVEVLGAGSSAMWQTAAIGAWKQLAGSGAQHYTVKGKCPSTGSTNCAQLHDLRSASILPEGGNLWVVWSADQSKVWGYLSVDSVVGNRSFFASPRVQLQVSSLTESTAGQQLISSSLWGSDAAALPAAVYNAINNASVTTAFTDIRPEDAKFAQSRAVSPLDTSTYSGLGYGTSANQLIGTQIFSAFSKAVANPVAFNISGSDPFTGQPVKAYTTISVGASPIVFIINRTNSHGLGNGAVKNIELANVQDLYNGTECNGVEFGSGAPNVPVKVILREPLSGTMNTTEFTNFRLRSTPNNSQEVGVDPPAGGDNNPLNKPCNAGGGSRERAIGTGEVVNTAVLNTADSIGYAFFGYGNFSKIAGTPSYGYVTLNGVDPIQHSYTNGELPTCTAPCPVTPGSSFPNLRGGTYRSWSVLRVVTDSAGANLTNTQALVTAMQENINSTVPDWVPFAAVGGDPGLKLYRSHYTQSGVAPNNGLGGQKESGGDVGGCIEHVGPPPGVLNCHQ
ncbi:MAG: hypothetical protein JOY62_13645 [Acidobacteriaceae bacterium]|nr:hypothetical protein [Acidobacteriaceae bacterium]MBV9781005.1 hypothetical protein [Acidobacteriaceae bacterium]